MSNVLLSLVVFRFNPANPSETLEFAYVEEPSTNQIWLPTAKWQVGYDPIVGIKHLIRKHIAVDQTWLNIDLIDALSIESGGLNLFYKISIPNNIATQDIEWMKYGQLEFISQRFMQSHFRSLRKASSNI